VAFAAVDAALQLTEGLHSVKDVRELEVGVSVRAARLGDNPHPTSADEAIVSIPYLVARTLADRSSVTRPLPSQFSRSAREREILRVCCIVIDPALDDSAARVRLNGGELEAACEVARGSARKPLGVAEVIDKFRLVSGVSDPDGVVNAVMKGDGDLGALLHLL
jgi:2-methylcitrate dehydratase PrpD